MARKGSHKVKTGCYTCKKRKVKCDETKPHCLRCTKTQRKCDGYTPTPAGLASYSWSDLLDKHPILPALTTRRNTPDGRALEFYHLVVAPALSRFPGDDFWTRMVAQASLQEPAVHHAVVAISSLYELVDRGPCDEVIASDKGRYAVVHYNRALQSLRQMRDESVVLFVCVLFICIESLRENRQGAMTHCRYGIKVFNDSDGGGSEWAREYFRPLFVRLTSCPYTFGQTIDYFPNLVGAEEEDVSGPHGSWEECRYRIDLMVSRCIRFVREYEIPSPNLPPRPAPDYSTYVERRDRLIAQLDEWLRSYDDLFATHPPPADNLSPYLMMVMMCLVSRIWVSACGAQDEMDYDDHLETFAEIVDLARQAAAVEKAKMQSNRTPLHKSKFVLEMGFVPTLYFVVVKCRNLALRQAALDYMTVLAPERENLWNTTLLYSVGKKIIEIEHGEASKKVAQVPAEQDPPQYRISGLATLPVKSREEMTTSLPPLPEAPPPEARVRDALVLRNPDVGLPGKEGLENLPHRPSRSVQFVVGRAFTPLVSEEVVAIEEPAATELLEGSCDVGMAAASAAGAVLGQVTKDKGVELPLTPPDEVFDEI